MQVNADANFAQADAWLSATRGCRSRIIANQGMVPAGIAASAWNAAIAAAKQAAATGDADAAKAAYWQANAASRTTYRR